MNRGDVYIRKGRRMKLLLAGIIGIALMRKHGIIEMLLAAVGFYLLFALVF